MKRLIKWLFILLVVVLGLAVALIFSKDAIAKAALVQQIRAQTGMDVKIGNFSVGLLSPIATIENLTLYNTADFGGTPFLNIRELHLEFDREALAHRELHLKLLKLNVVELSVVKNDLGQTNLVNLMAAAQLKPASEALTFKGIDVANLSVGRLVFLDLKNQKNNRHFDVNLTNQVFRNLKTSADFYGVFVLIYLRSGGG